MARIDVDLLRRGLQALGVTEGATLVVHSPLSAFGELDGGAHTVLRALRTCVGTAAEHLTEHQPFAHGLGADSPFSRLYDLKAQIVLLGVGHNRNSCLHHAESLAPGHRTKLRRFPYLVAGERV